MDIRQRFMGVSLLAAAAMSVFSVSAADTPTMGWSSWNTYRVNISEDLIKRQADAIVATGLKDCGYNHINIDDGWFGGRDKNGRHTCNPSRFPNGLRPVVDYIHSLGLKAGGYSDAGENTCGSYWDKDVLGVGVGFYQHDQQDADFFFKEMNFDFIKIDFCGGQAYCNSMKTNMNERERYTSIRKAIDATGRKDARINICRWDYPGTWVGEVGASWRISHDINPTWGCVQDIINQSLFLSAYARNHRYNDMDMLEIGRGMTVEEDRTHFALWCVFSSPLLIGCDLTTIKPEALALLKNRELIAVNQDPLGKQAKMVKKFGDDRYAFVKDLEVAGGVKRVVAFYNGSTNAANYRLAFAEVDLGGKVKVREIVEGRDLGELTDAIECAVPVHGTRVFVMEGEKRLEGAFHPAHWAYLNSYQELNRDLKTATYVDDPKQYPEVVAVRVGGSAENYMQWDEVWSERGGDYTFTVEGYPTDAIEFSVLVNGKVAGLANAANGYTVKTQLAAGMNAVRLVSEENQLFPVKGLKVEK